MVLASKTRGESALLRANRVTAMKRKASLLCLVMFLGLCGCDSNSPGELSGQVFIVTEGAVNFKLGLVEVTAIPQKDVLAFIAKKKGEVESVKASLMKKYEAAERAYDIAHNRWSKVTTAYTNALNSDAPENDQHVLGEAFEVRSAEYRNARSERDVAETDYKTFPTAGYFFEGIPNGIATSTTDADGKFLIKIPRTERYMLAAHASRQVLDKKEEYYWLVNVSLDGAPSKSIMLSNNNLFKPDSASSSK
jgi:hypothetical protein